MNKRNVATVLWFLMGWTTGSVLALLFNLSPSIGILLGFPFAAAVRYGPMGRVWMPTSKTRTIRPADEVAQELDRKAAPGSAAGEQAPF